MGNEIFTILLVEDNFLNRRMVKKILEKNYLVKEATDAEKADEILSTETVHLVIIDIHLGHDKKNGVWLAQRIKEKFNMPFIFLTAFGDNDIARKALSTEPYAYLTKPFKDVDLALSIEIALQKHSGLKPENKSFILVKDGDYFVKLPTTTIDYLVSTGNYLQVVSNKKIYKCRCTIKEMMPLLPEATFIQTHRAYIVNKYKIVKFNSYHVLIGGIKIPVSAKYAASLVY